MRIYLAAPVFSQAERVYNRKLAEMLRKMLPNCSVILPQDFRAGDSASFNDRRRFSTLFKQCVDALRSADVIVARLDGADADSGVSFEVGYARALEKPVVGIRTDYRQLQEKGLNLMLSQGCSDVVCRFSFDERPEALAEALAGRIERAIRRVPPKEAKGETAQREKR